VSGCQPTPAGCVLDGLKTGRAKTGGLFHKTGKLPYRGEGGLTGVLRGDLDSETDDFGNHKLGISRWEYRRKSWAPKGEEKGVRGGVVFA